MKIKLLIGLLLFVTVGLVSCESTIGAEGAPDRPAVGGDLVALRQARRGTVGDDQLHHLVGVLPSVLEGRVADLPRRRLGRPGESNPPGEGDAEDRHQAGEGPGRGNQSRWEAAGHADLRVGAQGVDASLLHDLYQPTAISRSTTTVTIMTVVMMMMLALGISLTREM